MTVDEQVSTSGPTGWPAVDLTVVGLGPIDTDASEPDQMNAFLHQVCRTASGESYLMWRRYMAIAAMVDLAVGWAADSSYEAHRVLEPRTLVAARLEVGLSIGPTASQNLVDRAEAARDRVPQCGRLLRDGVLSVAAFTAVVFETAAVTDTDLLAVIDSDAAAALAAAGALSTSRVKQLTRSVVRAVDPDGVRRAREEDKTAKGIRSWPVGGAMAALLITGACEEVAQAEAAIDATIAGVCPQDPRTKPALRADAALARLAGTAFGCACGAEDCAAQLSQAQIDARCARMIVHVVCDQQTLAGGDKPGFIDGFGAIDADAVREVAARASVAVRPLDLAAMARAPAQAADGYRPSTACDVAVRAVFGQCTWPGCSRRAWRCDLDHVCEYNHVDPAAGGPTCFCNLNPKCEFHHLLKTFADGWVDDQIIDANGVIWTQVTTPEGFTVRSQALNTWLIPDLGLLPCTHGGVDPPGRLDDTAAARGPEPMRATTRLEAKHAYRQRLRAQHRQATRSAPAKVPTWEDDTGPIPF